LIGAADVVQPWWLGPPASTKVCWWHIELAGGPRRRGCAAAAVSV